MIFRVRQPRPARAFPIQIGAGWPTLGLGVILSSAAPAAPQPLVALSDSVVDTKALLAPTGAPYGRAMNGLAFQHEILLSHNGWQYTAWYDTVGTDQNFLIARRSVLGAATGPWQIFDTGSDLINGDEGSWDNHNTISLGICRADGTLHASWDHHGNTLRYRRSVPGLATHADHSWGSSSLLAEQSRLVSGGAPVTAFTYPLFIDRPDGGLLFAYRTGSTNAGSNWIARYSPAAGSYAAPVLVSVRDGTYTGPSNNGGNFTSTSRNAYTNGLDFAPDGSLHYTFTWRENVVASNHDVCHAFSTDGGITWRNSAGTQVADTSLGQALRVDTPGLVVVPLDGRQQLINQQAQTVDAQGRLHVLVYHRRQEPGFAWQAGQSPFFGPTTTAYFHYVRDPATGNWSGRRLPVTYPTGSRPDVETLPNGDVHAVFVSEGKLVFAGATAAAGYEDWTILATHGTNFEGEPRLDHDRLRKAGILSVFIAEGGPSSSTPLPVPLRVIEYATGPVFEAHAGQDQRATDSDGNGSETFTLAGSVGAHGGPALASARWLSGTTVLSSSANLDISLPVGTHEIEFEATSDTGLVSGDRVVLTVASSPLVPVVTATATSHDGNLPVNTLDGDLATRWSAFGIGESITWDLGWQREIASVSLAFFLGDQRQSYFDLRISTDGVNWTTVLADATSGGTSTAAQMFSFTPVNGRYIRYVGKGNSASLWNSLTEAAFETYPPSAATPPLAPYSPDAATLHLWHLDENAPPFANAAAPAHALAGSHHGALASVPALTGFGTAVNFNTGTGSNRGIITYAATLSSAVTADVPNDFAYHGPDGAFTLEALVKFDSAPGSWALPGHIIAMDGDGSLTEDRVFQFRVVPNAGAPLLQFQRLYGAVEALAAPIPLVGKHAVNTTDWFHVAVTYSGVAGEPGNMGFYWTRVVPGLVEANPIGSATLSGDFNHATMRGDFSLGNEARSTGGSTEFFAGSIDEVRISSIARAADGFHFRHPDADNDGLPDAWEIASFGSTNGGPEDDSDGDGTRDGVEFALGLDAANPSSRFVAALENGPGIRLTWPAADGLSFRVLRAANPAGPWLPIATVITTSASGEFTDTDPLPDRGFYAIEWRQSGN